MWWTKLLGNYLLLMQILAMVVVVVQTLTPEVKITFWIDAVQQDIYDDIASTLKELDALHLDAQISDAVLVLKHADINDENDDAYELDANADNMAKFCEILSSTGTAIVVDWSYYPWQQGIEFVNNANIPYIKIDRIMRPFLDMFSAYMRQKEANNIAMIFQNERDKEEALLHMMDGYPFRTLIFNANDRRDFISRLRALRPSPSYYAIFARGTAMNSIFERIDIGGLFQRAPEWHFIYLDPRDRVFKYRKQVEYATRFAMNSRSLCRSMQMKDAYCSSGFTLQRALLLDAMRSIIEAAQQNMATTFYMQECNDSSILSPPLMQTQEALTDFWTQFRLSDFLIYSRTESFNLINDIDNSATMGDMDDAARQFQELTMPTLTYSANISINFYSNEHEAVTDLAIWHDGELRKINQTISPAKRFFRIGTAVSVPWSYYRRDTRSGEIVLDKNGAPIWEGFCIDFIEALSKNLNFEYEIVAPTSGHFGQRNEETGLWDGLVGDLVSGETDFVVAALKMYSEREEVIDFLPPYYEQTGISIVIRKPVRRTSLFKFMTVLRVEVWLSIIAALVGTALMIWFMDKFSPYSSRNNRDAYPYACREFTLRESFWFALTSFTPQGGGEAPKAVSGRMLVAAYWLFVVLMLATFTANLAAFLTVERMQTPVQSLEQLARQSRINYTVVHESDAHQFFINMKFAEDTLYRMWKELALNASKDFQKFRIWDYPIKEQFGHILLAINASGPVKDADEGFRKVNEHENADFAFIHDSAEIKYQITRNCNLTEVGEVFAEQPYAVAVQQGSHLGDELSYTILELQKDRFFEELKAKYWNHSYLPDCSQSESQEGITLESLGGVFIATLFGLGLAMLTLGLEVFYYKKRHQLSNSARSITQVKPLSADQQKSVLEAWHIGIGDKEKLTNSIGNTNLTPPPSFEVATSRGARKPPTAALRSVTIGVGGEFKPRRLGLQSRRELPKGYME